MEDLTFLTVLRHIFTLAMLLVTVAVVVIGLLVLILRLFEL